MATSDYWDAETAQRYDKTSSNMFEPDVLDPAVDFLESLADGGPALELAIGTGRVAIPLVDRGVSVTGIELSQPMVDELHKKRPDLPVVVGDMATTRAPGEFSLVFVVWKSRQSADAGRAGRLLPQRRAPPGTRWTLRDRALDSRAPTPSARPGGGALPCR